MAKSIYLGNTKTGDIRYLNLPKETTDLLRQHKRDQLRLQLVNGDRWQHTGFVFTTDDGSNMNPGSITGWLHDFPAATICLTSIPMHSGILWSLFSWQTERTL